MDGIGRGSPVQSVYLSLIKKGPSVPWRGGEGVYLGLRKNPQYLGGEGEGVQKKKCSN